MRMSLRADVGSSSKSATRRNFNSTERRAASVGCAVNTGRTFSRAAMSATWSDGTAAADTRSATWASSPPNSARSAASVRARCTCSAMFARWKNVLNARASKPAVSTSVPSSNWAAAAGSVRTNVRTRSTCSSRSAPSWRTRLSPSSVPSRRISARRAESAVASVGVITRHSFRPSPGRIPLPNERHFTYALNPHLSTPKLASSGIRREIVDHRIMGRQDVPRWICRGIPNRRR